jgi:hypothetical protein
LVGKLRSDVLQCDGRKFEITLGNVNFVLDLWIKLFSFSKALMNGFMIGNEGELIMLTKGGTKLVSNQLLNTKEDFVSAIKMATVLNQLANNAFETKNLINIMSVMINKLHKIPGHCGETHLKVTANAYGNIWKTRSL